LRAGFFQAKKRKLDNFYFFSLHAFLAAGSDERNLLAFFQALEAVSLDGFEVYEQVVTRLWSDEAEAFFIVEPLNGTGLAIGHWMSPWTKLTTVQETPWPRLSAKSRKIHEDVLIEILHQVEILSDIVQHSDVTLTLFPERANGLVELSHKCMTDGACRACPSAIRPLSDGHRCTEL
jgi:hypothetical protein